jgi:predicted thioesterase
VHARAMHVAAVPPGDPVVRWGVHARAKHAAAVPPGNEVLRWGVHARAKHAAAVPPGNIVGDKSDNGHPRRMDRDFVY